MRYDSKAFTELSRFYYPAEGTARAAILALHGLAEHTGRYLPLFQAWQAAGFDVYAYDQRGHGASPGPRALVNVDWLIRDHLQIRNQIQAQIGQLPFFLFGHSMGGLVTVRSVERDPRGVAGVILSGPALTPTPEPLGKAAVKAARTLARVLPKFPMMSLDTEHLTHDEAIAAAAEKDELNYRGKLPALTCYSMYDQGAKAITQARFWQKPTLLFHGTADVLAYPRGTEEFLATAGSHLDVKPEIQVRWVEGDYHEVFNELDAAKLREESVAWLNRQLDADAK